MISRNKDQGVQFTSNAFTKVLKDNHVAISMDGRGRCQDNIFIEGLWWTLKHQYVYLHSFDTGKSFRRGFGKWIQYYNLVRGHSSLNDKTPEEVYLARLPRLPDAFLSFTFSRLVAYPIRQAVQSIGSTSLDQDRDRTKRSRLHAELLQMQG